ncbi:MAG: hypothetical protein J6U54_11030 [Clostridiales bacterium]|nr:hypothetical protein [Clostridiales bacterium]
MLEVILNTFLVISVIVFVGVLSWSLIKICEAELWYKAAYAEALTSMKELFDVETEQIKDIMKEGI